MKLIGITGKKRTGKDTAAATLSVECGYDRFAFASLLKAMTYSLLARLGIDPQTAYKMVDGDLKEMPCPQLCGKHTRWVMQTLGTEWGRKCIDENFWVRATLRAASSADKAVISDVRFANEAQAIRDAGGRVVRLLRGNDNGDSHASEVMDFDVDFTIDNNGTINQLREYILDYEHTI